MKVTHSKPQRDPSLGSMEQKVRVYRTEIENTQEVVDLFEPKTGE